MRGVIVVLMVIVMSLMIGVTYSLEAEGPAIEAERYEKIWCKEPGGELEACAIKGTP